MIYLYSSSFSNRSNGIKVGFQVVSCLRALGLEAVIACRDPAKGSVEPVPESSEGIVYSCESRVRLGDGDIAIYPEVVPGNPLRARNVVRYLLNKPYFLTGQGIDYGEYDYLTVYSRVIDAELPRLCVLFDERYEIEKYRNQKKENQLSVYIGKIYPSRPNEYAPAIERLAKKYDRVKLITRRYPALRSDLFNTIARSALLVCVDPMTNLGFEATLLGTPVLQLDDSFGAMRGLDGIPLLGFCADSEGIPRATEAREAFDAYCGYLAAQTGLVGSWFGEVDRHFSRTSAHGEEGYREARRHFIDERRAIDKREFGDRRSVPALAGINHPRDVPDAILSATGRIRSVRWMRRMARIKSTIKSLIRRIRAKLTDGRKT
jgi:hypothetical protein